MGLFDKMKDKVKGALNIDGVKVEVTEVEDEFPITDTVMKGRFTLTTASEHEILSITASVIAEMKPQYAEDENGPDSPDPIILGEEIDDADNEVIGRDFQYPCTIKPGEDLQDSFNILLDDSPQEMMREQNAKIEHYDFFVTVEADVKGTPFDPEGKKKFQII
ncbi:MAG: hypothetical protein AAF518_12540 [Spirochaetota bacterium]